MRPPTEIVVNADAGHTVASATVVLDWRTLRANGSAELRLDARVGAVTAWCGFCGTPADPAPGVRRSCCDTAKMFTTEGVQP